MMSVDKNDGGILLHLNFDDREILFNALRYYSGFCSDENYILEKIDRICELINVLESSDFDI